MKPRPPKEVKSDDLFRSRLTQIINTRHELARLIEQIDWAHIDQQVQPFFAAEGRPAIPSRLMVGLHILKSMCQLSDEAVCERWVENPYYQYFCGEEFFQHEFPIQRSSMTHWRKRVGETFFEKLLQESLRIAFDTKALKTNQLKCRSGWTFCFTYWCLTSKPILTTEGDQISQTEQISARKHNKSGADLTWTRETESIAKY